MIEVKTIKIEGYQFEKNYLLYLIEIDFVNSNGKYFYIGQTGDRNYITARPAFRRLAGHLNDQGWSTENQVYRQIAVKILGIEKAGKRGSFDQLTKNRVNDFLNNSTVKMHYYPIQSFEQNSSLESHREILKRIERIEKELIFEFFNEPKFVDLILNKKIPKIRQSLQKRDLELKNEIWRSMEMKLK